MVFNHPQFKGILVKRCMGLPGDSLRFFDSKLLINFKEIASDSSEYSWFREIMHENEEYVKIAIPKYKET